MCSVQLVMAGELLQFGKEHSAHMQLGGVSMRVRLSPTRITTRVWPPRRTYAITNCTRHKHRRRRHWHWHRRLPSLDVVGPTSSNWSRAQMHDGWWMGLSAVGMQMLLPQSLTEMRSSIKRNFLSLQSIELHCFCSVLSEPILWICF